MTGLSAGSLWVTRIKADFPSGALANDLVLEATSSQSPVTNLHSTQTYTDPKYNPCPGSNGATGGVPGVGCACRTAESPQSARDRYVDVIATAFGAALLMLGSRRRRPRGL
jgi:MYXO-CTERM domain-containing protein